VVVLVLDHAADEALEFALDIGAVGQLRADLAPIGSIDGGVDSGEGEAALLHRRERAGAIDQCRIDQGQLLFGLLGIAGGIDHEDALAQADLGSGEPNAIVLVHRPEHRGHRLADGIVDVRQLLGPFAEDGLGVVNDVEFQILGHWAGVRLGKGGDNIRGGIPAAGAEAVYTNQVCSQSVGGGPAGRGDSSGLSDCMGTRPVRVYRSGGSDRVSVDFSKHIQKAEEALRRRNYDFAVELYRQLLDLNPDLGPARAGLRQAIRKRSEGKRGGKFLRSVGGAVPLAKARTMLKLGRYAAAADALEDFLAGQPLDEEANLMLGSALEKAGHLQSACAVFEFLAEIAPDNPEGLKRAGAMMRSTGDPGRAIEYYERALEADPRDRDALKARKDLAAETALTDSGLDQVAHSRELIRDKDKARLLERDHRRHRTEEELREELDQLRGRLGEDGRDHETRLAMAAIHDRLGESEEAGELVERLLSYRELPPAIRNKAGELHVRAMKRRIAGASKRGEEELANQLEAELQDFELGDLRRRVELEPADASLRLRLGKRLLHLGELDSAAAELQRAISDHRARGEALFYLGQCFQKKGLSDLARSQYTAALEGLPGASDRAKEILYNLGAISEAEGNATLARSFFVRIYEVDIGYRDVAEKMEQLK